jgi:photosystem II stability/assembly factor-like uncharacterized protein
MQGFSDFCAITESMKTTASKTVLLGTIAACLGGSLSAQTDRWFPTGPFGGDAEIVRVVPKVKGLVLAAARNGLIYSSVNGGALWRGISFPAQFGGVLHALEVDPRSASTWYVGMESESSWLSGVYKTTDGGATWNLLPETKTIPVWSLALYPGDPDTIAAGTGKGVYLSRDAGAHWTHISPPDDPEIRPVVSLAFDPARATTIYAGTTHLPWRTVDGGKTWHSIHEGMIDDSDVFSIQVDAKRPARVFASACSGVYSSQNEAEKWVHLDTPKGAFRTHFVALDPRAADVVFAGTTGGLLRSADSGHAWRTVSAESIKSIAFDPWVPGRIFFASPTAGLMISTDGGLTLHPSNFGFTNRNFTALTGSKLDLYTSSVFEASSGGLYRSETMGLRWDRTGTPGDDQILAMSAAPDQPLTIFAATYHGLLASEDGGKTWKPRKGPPADRIAAVIAFSNKNVLAGTSSGIFRTLDGATWIQSGIEGVVSLHRSGPNMISALTAQGALASGDNGATWQKCGPADRATAFYAVDFDSANASLALAATSTGLFRSTDGCRTWSAVSSTTDRSANDRSGLRAETAGIVVFHPTRSGEAYASQAGRVFRSTDGGQRWQPLDDGTQGNSGPTSLVILPASPDRLFALFPRRGVFSISIKETPLQ